MPPNRLIDWRTAEVRDGNLHVRLTGWGDEAWVSVASVAQDMVSVYEGETRGQSWQGVTVGKLAICVHDVTELDPYRLQRYLTSLVAVINQEVHPARQRRGAQPESQEETTQQQSDAYLTELFRTAPA